MKIYITKKAEKELDKLPDQLAQQIINQIKLLVPGQVNSKVKKLAGSNNFRLRVGSFRVIFSVEKRGQELTILRVANRNTVYR